MGSRMLLRFVIPLGRAECCRRRLRLQPKRDAIRTVEKESKTSRLSQLVEANIIATHAYQVLLAKKIWQGRSRLLWLRQTFGP